KLPVCYDDDDDEESSNSLEDNIIYELPPCAAITPNEPVDSLSIGDEHLDTIPAMKSDKFIKYSVENLIPNPSESEGENSCDVPACFTTFSNTLFDVDYDFDSGDDQSFFDEDFSKKIYSNPLFDEEEETRFTKRLLYDNSSPRPPEEIVSDNSNADIESFSPSHIPVEDSDSRMEEIDFSLNPDDPMPPSIEDDDHDSKRDIPILKNCLTIIPFHSLTMSHTILIFLHPIVLLQNHQMVRQEL
nr:hypothetical protein [Tanacetum cinerariifolium]GEZ66769.1 hypothetical protein [Tanacetum cinerariifolium]